MVERKYSSDKEPSFSLRKELTVANALSIARPLLVMAANKLDLKNPLYRGLIGLAFLTDALDGPIARGSGKSPFGGLIDIVADHATEVLMYSRLKKEGIVPNWVPGVVTARVIATDIVRASHLIKADEVSTENNGVLKIEASPLSETIVASRVSRAISGASKVAVPMAAPDYPRLARSLAILAVAFNVVRGLPVLFNKRNKKLLG